MQVVFVDLEIDVDFIVAQLRGGGIDVADVS